MIFSVQWVSSREAAFVDLYRQAKITHDQLATALGLERFETEGLPERHNVTEDVITAEDRVRLSWPRCGSSSADGRPFL